MNKFLKIRDLITFDFLAPELVQIKDEYDNKTGVFVKTGGVSQGLRIKAAATHSGIVTGNNMLYLPDRMRRSVHTFVKDYAKPVLVHHNDHADPIGRIVDASYVDTSKNIRDMLADKKISDSLRNDFSLTDSVIEDFCAGNMPHAMQVDFARSFLCASLSDGKFLQDSKEYNGLGFAQIICNITDEEAIQKFLDGRYLTGSVGAATDAAVCSICKQDWIDSGEPCEHEPGVIYDNAKMVLIAGNFFYEEWSVVNKPADKYCSVLELHTQDGVKNIEISSSSRGEVKKVTLGFPQYNIKESVMAKKVETQIVDEVQEATVTQISTEVVVATVIADSGAEAAVVEPPPPVIEDVEQDDAFLVRVLDAESMTSEESDKLYDLMWKDMDSELFKDAKLSTEKRKKLAASTFCGPDKSFPVPDCAHVTAARRLLDRYKGAGDKSKILACVNRKAKAMGCDSKQKDSLTHTRMLHMLASVLEEYMYSKGSPDKDAALDESDVKALTGVLKNLASAVTKDSMIRAMSADTAELQDVLKSFQDSTLLDEILRLEENLGELQDKLVETSESREALTEEYALLQSENESLRDQAVGAGVTLKDFKVKYLALVSTLANGAEPTTEELGAVVDEMLDSEIEKVKNLVDMKKVTDKLNNGTSRVPKGKVENPMSQANGTEARQELSLTDELEMIQRRYLDMLFRNSADAEAFREREISRLRAEGKLPVSDE